MKITEVKINFIGKEGLNVKAYVSILIDDCFVIKDIRIIERENGYLIAMPNRKDKSGEFRDVAHPINSETRSMIVNKILEVFYQGIHEKLSSIKRPEGYYLGFNRNNIHSITLYKENKDTETQQGEEIISFDLENFEMETLKELETEIFEYVNEK